LIGLFLFVLQIKAQVTGSKFAPDRTRWSSSAVFRTSIISMANVNNYVYICGDTIINSKYCQKICTAVSYSVNSSPSYFDTACTQFHGYIYYDNKKLYTDSFFTGTGTLLYDFNLTQGDTFDLLVTNLVGGCNGHNGYYKIPVDTVDSMYYGNQWRKRIIFKQLAGFDFGPNPIAWVEGIGDVDHGIGIKDPYNFGNGAPGPFSIYGFIDYCYCDWGYVNLNCFQEPGYSTYGNNCQVGLCPFSPLNIYPNPCSNMLFIRGGDITEIKLTNALGAEVLVTKSRNVDVSSLADGIYFVQLKTEEGTLIRKIIVQK